MKRLLSWLLAALMLLTMLPTAGWADDTASGTCGENLTWTLSDDGVLTISGTGDMTDYYSYSEKAPWHEYADRIQTAVLGNGVTSIGNEAFSDCSSLISVTIPNNVTDIGQRVFYGCSSLTSVTIPNSVTSIGGSLMPYAKAADDGLFFVKDYIAVNGHQGVYTLVTP